MESNEIRFIQLSELEILQMFKNLCESNHLRFYITAGTLLGAVRHKGFIPWDDDIDVVMPRKDYDLFKDLCDLKLPAEYYLQNSFTEENFPCFYSKIRKFGTEVSEPFLNDINIRKGISIDVFPLDACPENNKVAGFFFKLIRLLSSVYMGKVSAGFVYGSEKRHVQILYRVLSRLRLKSIRDIRAKVVLLCGKLCSGKRLCTVGGGYGYPVETYDASWFEKVTFLPSEGDLYPAPAGWDLLLTNMYGDYMQLPSEEDRKGHYEKVIMK